MKVLVKQFQSVKEARLDVEGFTVVTGKSNLGKTAVIRALAAMMFGAPGDYYVRRGESWAGGAFSHDDGKNPLTVNWRKVPANKRKPSLQPVVKVNGVEHTKVGKDHKALTEPHGIIEIETAGARLRPQVALQHDPMFLVAETPGTVAEVFKMLGRVDVVTEAQRQAKSDNREATSRTKHLKGELVEAESKRDELAHLVGLRQEFDKLEHLLTSEQACIEVKGKQRDLLLSHVALVPVTLPVAPPSSIEAPAQLTQVLLLRDLLVLIPKEVPEPPFLPSTPEELFHKIKLLRDYCQLYEEFLEVHDEIAQVEGEITATKQELEALRKEAGVCPLCEQGFDHADH